MPRLVVNLRDERPVWALPDWAVDEIRSAAPPGWEVVVLEGASDARGDGGAPSPEALEAIRGAEVYLGYGFPRELFRAAHHDGGTALRWVHSGAAGVGGSLYPEMRRSDIVLTNSAGVHAEPIAETVIATVLYFARGLDFAVHAQRRRRWDKDPFEEADTPVREIAGATLGVAGFGGIGRAVARRAVSLGMQVIAAKRSPGGAMDDGVELVHGPEGLRELLRRSDFVVLSLPRTPATEGLIGARELDLMPRRAVLVNVGRGGILDEDALAERLRSGRLRGAALDVFETEPLPGDSPLWEIENLLIMPHVSGTTRGFWRREVDLIVENLRRYAQGRALVNTVDKQAGY